MGHAKTILDLNTLEHQIMLLYNELNTKY